MKKIKEENNLVNLIGVYWGYKKGKTIEICNILFNIFLAVVIFEVTNKNIRLTLLGFIIFDVLAQFLENVIEKIIKIKIKDAPYEKKVKKFKNSILELLEIRNTLKVEIEETLGIKIEESNYSEIELETKEKRAVRKQVLKYNKIVRKITEINQILCFERTEYIRKEQQIKDIFENKIKDFYEESSDKTILLRANKMLNSLKEKNKVDGELKDLHNNIVELITKLNKYPKYFGEVPHMTFVYLDEILSILEEYTAMSKDEKLEYKEKYIKVLIELNRILKKSSKAIDAKVKNRVDTNLDNLVKELEGI